MPTSLSSIASTTSSSFNDEKHGGCGGQSFIITDTLSGKSGGQLQANSMIEFSLWLDRVEKQLDSVCHCSFLGKQTSVNKDVVANAEVSLILPIICSLSIGIRLLTAFQITSNYGMRRIRNMNRVSHHHSGTWLVLVRFDDLELKWWCREACYSIHFLRQTRRFHHRVTYDRNRQFYHEFFSHFVIVYFLLFRRPVMASYENYCMSMAFCVRTKRKVIASVM